LATDKVEKLELKKLRSYYTAILRNLERKENERDSLSAPEMLRG
jgi:hypothetical protein